METVFIGSSHYVQSVQISEAGFKVKHWKKEFNLTFKHEHNENKTNFQFSMKTHLGTFVDIYSETIVTRMNVSIKT